MRGIKKLQEKGKSETEEVLKEKEKMKEIEELKT